MTTRMDAEIMEGLRRRLLQEKSELEQRVRENVHFGLGNSYRDSTGDLSTNDNHPADGGTEMFERGKDIALLDKETLRLQRVEAALGRMESGEYGHCAACGKFIPLERLEALPTAIYCMEHEPMRVNIESRPVEEKFLSPPFGRTSLDERDDHYGFDGEDAWQIVESWGTSNTPAMAEGNNIDDYGSMAIESDENDGFVEPIESFLATDITGNRVSVVRNRAYHRYMAEQEGDPLLEPDEYAED